MWVGCTQTLAEDGPVLPPLHPEPEFEGFAALEADGYNSTVLHLENVVAPSAGFATLDQGLQGRVDVVRTPVPYAGRDGAQARFLLRPHSSD